VDCGNLPAIFISDAFDQHGRPGLPELRTKSSVSTRTASCVRSRTKRSQRMRLVVPVRVCLQEIKLNGSAPVSGTRS
jgi:hypothetical protein